VHGEEQQSGRTEEQKNEASGLQFYFTTVLLLYHSLLSSLCHLWQKFSHRAQIF
jgi:hypothetical protein